MPVLFHLTSPYDALLVALAIALPLIAGACALVPFSRRAAFYSAPFAALPALALSMAGTIQVSWSGFMLGTTFAVGGAGSVWLFITSVLWLASAWYGLYYLAEDKKRERYVFFFLGAMAGNFGIVLARDAISFFAAYALMSILSYGLVIHDGKPEPRRAGRVYLSMAVFGEAVQLAALCLLFYPMIGNSGGLHFQSLESMSMPGGLITGLLIAGFGIKAGLLGLHVWLPMAHPVAPTPASAVLSGSMIKAGLIGWMTFLPLGRVALPDVSAVLIVLGLTGSLVAAVIGAIQSNPKSVLAYSSVSQMGLMTAGIGVAAGSPSSWPVMMWIIVVYAAHHAFTKSLLFLSVGLKTTRPLVGPEHWMFWSGTIFAGLALIGMPFTSGVIAKNLLADAIAGSSHPHHVGIVIVLTVAATGTALLMIRYVMTLRNMQRDRHHGASAGIWVPWLLLLLMVMMFTLMFARYLYMERIATMAMPPWWKSSWPLLVGMVLYIAAQWVWRKRRWKRVDVPPGDLFHVMSFATVRIVDGAGIVAGKVSAEFSRRRDMFKHAIGKKLRKAVRMLDDVEVRLTVWSIGGFAVMLAAVMIFWLALS